jgi:phytoene dehydrogenase-like protein
MTDRSARDAVVIGSGPNGLAAAIALAERGLNVLVVEGADTIGGGVRSAPLTIPGFTHDVCSSVYPMVLATPFFRRLPLNVDWVHAPNLVAHPFDDRTAATLKKSVDETADALGSDAAAYRKLLGPLAARSNELLADLVGPLGLPRHPLLAARFGWPALKSGRGFAESYFRGERTRALWAGLAAHAVLPLETRPGAAIALMLAISGHAHGWPFARGGAQSLADALAAHFRSIGGTIETGHWIRTIDELPPAKAILLDVSPRQAVALAGHRWPKRYSNALLRYRHGPGVFKVDWALSGPIPWAAAECRTAGTVHLGGTLDEIATAERGPFEERHVDRPFVLLVQPSPFDPTRAPAGQHTAWGYCHVPNGSTEDMTERIERQVERFAPGFRDVVLARHSMSPAALERYNPNYVGGDISGGVADLVQLFARPVARWNPYTTPEPYLYLCSSSTPPGGGVHGMCGYYAAQAAWNRVFKRPRPAVSR